MLVDVRHEGVTHPTYGNIGNQAVKCAFATAFVLTLGLSACAAPKVWNKAGATQQDYATDSYMCEKDSRQSGYFGGGVIGALNMQDFDNRCMVAHGWYLSNQSVPTQANPTADQPKLAGQLKSAIEQRKSCTRGVRDEQVNAPLLSHFSDIDSGRFSMRQLADQQVATQVEGELLVRYFDETASCTDQFTASATRLVPAIGPIIVNEKSDIQAVALSLIRRQLTWGEAAQKQQDIQDAATAKLRAIRL